MQEAFYGLTLSDGVGTIVANAFSLAMTRDLDGKTFEEIIRTEFAPIDFTPDEYLILLSTFLQLANVGITGLQRYCDHLKQSLLTGGMK